MCGIVGCIGHGKIQTVVLNGLEKLEYRGYDSAGGEAEKILICIAGVTWNSWIPDSRRATIAL